MKKFKLITIFAISFFLLESCNKDSVMITDIEQKKPSKTYWNLSEWSKDIPDPCKQVCLVAGQHMYVGTVDIAENNGDLLVTYNVTEPDVYIEEIHLDIFNSIDEFKAAKKVSNGGAIPGKFEYKKEFNSSEMKTAHTVLIPKSYVDHNGGADCIFIASHAALSNGETAWGGLCDTSDDGITNLDSAKQFPGRNWSVYFEFCAEECTESINFTYAWEDLNEFQTLTNDTDYNDLVIQADLIKSASELKISFLAKARGAGYDHQFKFRISKTGVTGIFGADAVVDDGLNWLVTVFESTKAALPGEGISPFTFSANTNEDDDTCTPNSTVEIVITTNGDFIFDNSKPYEPFITVFPLTGFGDGPYDLDIYEISGNNTFILDGKEFPNGILISSDWKWPLEGVAIKLGYPDFTSLTEGWTPNWADNLADPSKVFNCN